MYFPFIINWTSPFPILGLLGEIFHLYSNSNNTSVSNSGEPDQTPRFAASDLILHCLPMSHKKGDRLIRVKGVFVYRRRVPNLVSHMDFSRGV